jgi:predicted NUDIX family phosphoesterase
MQREVSEELGLSLEFDYKADTDKYYLIYDTSNEVGKTHLGVVCIVQYSEEVLEQLASDRHDEIENLRLIDNKDLQSVPNPENWTKFIIESGALTK